MKSRSERRKQRAGARFVVAQKLRAFMETRRVSQVLMSVRIGISQGALSRILSGETEEIRSSTVQQIAAALELDVAELLDPTLTVSRPRPLSEPELGFDAFLAHRATDRAAATQLATALRARGLRCWLDQDQLRPGLPWQAALEAGIAASRSLVILVGKSGSRPWQALEMRAALTLATARRAPVIPVLLPGVSDRPELPPFLTNRTWVDLRSGLTGENLDKLIWGLTGQKPRPQDPPAFPAITDVQPPAVASPAPATGGFSSAPFGRTFGPNLDRSRTRNAVDRVRCKLNCQEKQMDFLHMRPAAFLARLCLAFPGTEFRIIRDSPGEPPLNPKSLPQMLVANFEHGEEVTLEVTGQLRSMAAVFFRTVWENLDGFSDDIKEAKARLTALVDRAFSRIYDPELDELEDHVIDLGRIFPQQDQEHRLVAVINDRLHYLSLPMLPLVAKHFNIRLQIAFSVPENGIYFFTMGSESNWELDPRIVDMEIAVGTEITVLTSGVKAQEGGQAIRDVLENLWQCDAWLRQGRKDFQHPDTVQQLVEFAREMRGAKSAEYSHVKNPFLSDLLTAKHVFVNLATASLTKGDVLRQLAAVHSQAHGLETSSILREVLEAERKMPVVLRPGFALAHGAMEKGPRIAMSFGVYPNGVVWTEGERDVKLVAVVLYAKDTQRTWRDYRKRLSMLFHTDADLEDRLVRAREPKEFLSILRNAEIGGVGLEQPPGEMS